MRKVLFWDFDGTLALPNESFAEALHGALKEQGVPFTMEDARRVMRHASSWYMPDEIYPGRTGELWWSDLFGRMEAQLGTMDHEKLRAAFRDRVVNYRYTLYADAEETLARCSGMGYANYIMSNNFPELTETIRRYGLDKYFAGYVISAAAGYEKPRAELFRYGLELAGDPELCYMIGDNPVADIGGGSAAGLKTILVHRDCESEASYSCRALAEIPPILK